MARTDSEYVHDLAFDWEDVDVVDFVNMTQVVHGEVCPEIVDEKSQEISEHV